MTCLVCFVLTRLNWKRLCYAMQVYPGKCSVSSGFGPLQEVLPFPEAAIRCFPDLCLSVAVLLHFSRVQLNFLSVPLLDAEVILPLIPKEKSA